MEEKKERRREELSEDPGVPGVNRSYTGLDEVFRDVGLLQDRATAGLRTEASRRRTAGVFCNKITSVVLNRNPKLHLSSEQRPAGSKVPDTPPPGSSW